jgi:hypothetical protein
MPNPNSDIYVSVSANGGDSFSSPYQINALSNDLGNMPIQDIASNGDVFVLWVDYNVISGGEGVLMLDKSTDGGVSWGNDIIIDTINLPPIRMNQGVDVRSKGAAILRTGHLDSNILYVVYAADPDSNGLDEADVFFIKSIDGGVNWSSPKRINRDQSTNDQILPWMEVSNDGIIDIAWYDRRNDVSDLQWDIYYTYSLDGGDSFEIEKKLNSSSFGTSVSTRGGPWFGEYLGMTVIDSVVFVSYCSSQIDLKGDVLTKSFKNPTIPTISVNELETKDFKIYPNPAGNQLFIETSDFINVQVSIKDLSGRVVMKTDLKGERCTIDLHGISGGIYLVQLSNADYLFSKKIVKLDN